MNFTSRYSTSGDLSTINAEKEVSIRLDYRSTWYRPDVVGGQLYEDDTLETLRERYYGSQYLCISTEYVDTILAEGNYAAEIKDKIREASADAAADSDYVVINLK